MDSSFVTCRLLPDESSIEVDQAFEEHTAGKLDFLSSPILPLEVLNALKSAVLSKRIDEHQAKTLTSDFQALDIKLQDIDLEKTLSLSLEKNCSVYDASYLHLSKKHALPLLTLDRKLKTISN
ncbi:MAG: type II toxin-antitoxin system VapC family toxin [bacterium]|nr:type II toxin-antitoxin system VapC family toxin [bacterium]